jgi:hypothetical protein
VGLEWDPLSLVRINEGLLERKVATPVHKFYNYGSLQYVHKFYNYGLVSRLWYRWHILSNKCGFQCGLYSLNWGDYLRLHVSEERKTTGS